jgi:hypothetical protein
MWKKKDSEKINAAKKIIKVIFTNTYCGNLGVYYKENTYELPFDIYKRIKNDCKEVE